MSLAIRAAGPDDADRLAEIHKACFPAGWNAQSFVQLCAPPGFVLMASRDLSLGLIAVRYAAGEAEILTIAVLPAARNAGVGAALVQEAASRADHLGATKMFLEVATDNAAAGALYGKLGFVPVGKRRAYYPVPGQPAQDADILKAELPLRPLGK